MQLVETIPGLRQGNAVVNAFVIAVYLCLLLVWPLLLAYGVATNYNGIASYFGWVPGVSDEGGPLSAVVVGFTSALIVYFLMMPFVGGVAFLGLFVGVTIVLGIVSVGCLRAWWVLRSSDPDSLLTISAGPVELEGTARPDDQTVTTPYTNRESLLCDYEKERRERKTDEDGNVEYTWNTVDSGSLGTRFMLESDGREILVDPQGMDRMLDRNHRTRSGNTRVKEHRLDPGDSAYVTGLAVRPADTAIGDDVEVTNHRYVLTAPDSDLPAALRRVQEPPAIISDTSESSVLLRLFGRGVVFGIGAAVLCYPIWLMVQGTFF